MIVPLKAGQPNRLSIVGNYFRVIEATTELIITAEYNDGSTEINRLNRGMGWGHRQEFTAITIESEFEQQIQIAYSKGQIDDNRMSGVIDVRNKPLFGFTTTRWPVDTAETIITQANASRHALRVKNISTNGAIVSVGSQDVAINGYPLSVGEFIQVDSASAAEVYAVSDIAGGLVAVIEEYVEGEYLSVPIEPLQTNTGAFIFTESGDYISLGN